MPEAVEPRRAAVEQYLGALSTLQVFAPASVFEASEKADRSFKKYVELLRKHYEEKTASDADVKSAEKEFSADFRALISVMRNDIKSG
ncbi:hypothetical protein BMG00_12000 [Thioclava marina]|uniref:Uncharacterized protein n=2 Tax=Thioclava marina TaxID=1915077 RepID=A0ABX3MJR3_9RHOB|nr:hypothetical protein BMG00_12000 [Thioclava marina]